MLLGGELTHMSGGENVYGHSYRVQLLSLIRLRVETFHELQLHLLQKILGKSWLIGVIPVFHG